MAEKLPVWSPDGSTLLYVAGPPTNTSAQLWTLALATGLRTQLASDPTLKDQTRDWSPDGEVIAHHAGDDIWRMAADGTDQVNLTQTPSVAEFGTAFSPDGTKISFTGTDGPVPAGERYVQVMAVDGGGRRGAGADPRPAAGSARLATVGITPLTAEAGPPIGGVAGGPCLMSGTHGDVNGRRPSIVPAS